MKLIVEIDARGFGTVRPADVPQPAPVPPQQPQPPRTDRPVGGRVTEIALPWENTSSTGRIKTGSYGPFGPNDILAVRFTIPANHTTGGLKFSMAEWGGGPVQREACISQSPGDFNGTKTGVSARTSVNVVATIGGQPQPYQAHLQPGQTYYLNVKNLSCQADTCDMFIDFTKW
jgi:hypothetical protein